MAFVAHTEADADKPFAESMRLHSKYQGKIQLTGKFPIQGVDDWAFYYTPGVGAPCRAIEANPDEVFELTNRGNTVAVVTDGSRVLGLGNIGPEAGLPVMEGKALLYKYFGGVDAFPICLGTQDQDEIIQAVRWLEPSFGGINLEDIASPKCFDILDRLREHMDIPVWHDDQQGTATVILAALINALKIVNKRKEDTTIAVIGSGAANIAIVDLLIADGFKPANMIVIDSRETLHSSRSDLETMQADNPKKWRLCNITNPNKRKGGIAEGLKGMDVCIAMSKPGPGTIEKEWVSTMANDSIVFVCANPIPELWPWEAHKAGARIVATGRSDFANQVNNSLGFPGIFRGALDVRAKHISDEMCLAAAYSLAENGESQGLDEEHILPPMQDPEAYINEAVCVGLKAIEQGIARVPRSEQELRQRATRIIMQAQHDLQRPRESIPPAN
jgi:malate dehydrogenase (oxaloacetate-decarboxylating)